MTYMGLIHRYGQYLDLPAHTKNISLLEGNTPLIPMPRLGKDLGCDLYVKFEGLNPTGSFNDRKGKWQLASSRVQLHMAQK
jgi:threonine synthase